MASHLDLEEQEQLDQLKHFWRRHGNWITGLLLAVLLSLAAWNAYQYWQRSQATQAASLYDEFERTARAGDLDKLDRVLADMRQRFASTLYAQQASLLAAKLYQAAGRDDAAVQSLRWVVDQSSDNGYQALARLRLAALLMDQKKLDAALAELSASFPVEFQGLVADRKGDIQLAQGDRAGAIQAFRTAYQSLEPGSDYRRLVDVKLASLGVNPRAEGSSTDTGPKP